MVFRRKKRIVQFAALTQIFLIMSMTIVVSVMLSGEVNAQDYGGELNLLSGAQTTPVSIPANTGGAAGLNTAAAKPSGTILDKVSGIAKGNAFGSGSLTAQVGGALTRVASSTWPTPKSNFLSIVRT